jgi:solute carrier family 25 protein 14/30
MTFPSDLIKTRLQLQGGGVTDKSSKGKNKYRGMLHCARSIVKQEGLTALYNGIKPALLRQATFGTLKLGFYHYTKKMLSSMTKRKSSNDHSLISNMLCGMISGASAISICNPTDVLKVRMQSKKCPTHTSSMTQMFKEMYQQEGFSGLYRGVLPNAQRAAIITALELSTYDSSKKLLTTHLSIMRPESLITHLTAGSMAGLIATVGALPIDVIKTRMMSQRVVKGGSARIYQGSLDCLLTTVRSEGVAALYKGFLPSYLRIAPFNIIFFLTYEKLINFKPK